MHSSWGELGKPNVRLVEGNISGKVDSMVVQNGAGGAQVANTVIDVILKYAQTTGASRKSEHAAAKSAMVASIWCLAHPELKGEESRITM